MFLYDYDQIIRENFDLSDKNTRRYIVSLKEDHEQEQLLSALSSALYDKIVSKVDEIDFGTIPMSRGDITKVQGFDNTVECLNIIRKIVLEYKQDPSIVDVVLTSINNIKDRKGLFIKAYALNVEFPMLLYNLMVLSIERATSLMIATSIEFIKDPSNNTVKQALDKAGYKKTMDDTMYHQLSAFNELCKTKQIDKILEAAMKTPVKEDFCTYSIPTGECDEIPVVAVAHHHDPIMNHPHHPFDEDPMDRAPFVDNDEPNKYARIFRDLFTPDDTEVDIKITPDEEPVDDEVKDTVDPANIPSVVPGDSLNCPDRAINELEVNKESEDALSRLASVAGMAKKGFEKMPDAQQKILGGVAIGGAIVLTSVLVAKTFTKCIIPLLRNCVYTFYYTKFKLADYLDIQATLIEANAAELENSTDSDLSDEKKKKVVEKQRKCADRLRKWSNKLAMDSTKTKNQTKKQVSEDEKEKKKISTSEDGDVLF